jgi:hypothetical protein
MKLGILLLILSLNAVAAPEPLSQVDPSCVCDKNSKDVLEEPQKFNFGEFRGQCVDSCHFRRGRILPGSASPHIFKVGNILNFGSFYTASIPLQNFDAVEMGFEEFLPGINHVFLRFRLKSSAPSLKLKSQTTKKLKVLESRTLVISPEAVPPRGRKYKIFESYFGNYLIAMRVTTGEEMERWAKDLKHSVRFVPLQVSAEKIAGILRNGIQDSNDNSLKEIYKLFTNNCSTRALKFIDVGIGHRKEQSLFGWREFEEALPLSSRIGTIRALQVRSLTAN